MSLETCLSIGRIASILGLSKEEMQAKRDIEDKANQRLNQMSETDLKFFKGIGGGGGVLGGDDEEEEMKIDLTPNRNDHGQRGKAKIQVLGKKNSGKISKEPKEGVSPKSSSLVSPSPTSSASSSKTHPSKPQIQELSKVEDDDDENANPLQMSRLSRDEKGDDDFWGSVARDLDPSRKASSSTGSSKCFKSTAEALEKRSAFQISTSSIASKSSPTDNNVTIKEAVSPVVADADDRGKLHPVPTTALQLQGDLTKLKKQSMSSALRYLKAISPVSVHLSETWERKISCIVGECLPFIPRRNCAERCVNVFRNCQKRNSKHLPHALPRFLTTGLFTDNYQEHAGNGFGDVRRGDVSSFGGG